MKQGIHPKYHNIVITCNCGAQFQSGSTKSDIKVDICAKCHPFFTGEMRFVDALGRVEKFQQKQKAASKKKKKNRHSSQSGPRTLSDIRAAN